MLALAVTAAALSVNAAMAVLQHRQTAEVTELPAGGPIEEPAVGAFQVTSEITEISVERAMEAGDESGPPIEGFETPVVIEGQGTTPMAATLDPGLWIAEVRFFDYTSPTLGTIPGVNIRSREGMGGMRWSSSGSATSWAALHVGGWIPTQIPGFTPGAVIVNVDAIPEDVQWLVRFRRLGELERPDGALNWSDVRR